MDKFTPGPWVVDDEDFISPASNLDIALASVMHMDCDESRVKKYWFGQESEANARLIAAAPDLLADLRLAAETLRRYQALHEEKGTRESLVKAIVNRDLADRFDATIDKATAGQITS